MNMLTQDADHDIEVLTQLPTSSSCSKVASKRGSNYNYDEDIQLCISWMNVSYDQIVGNDQPSKIYWTRIADHYNATRPSLVLIGMPIPLNMDGGSYKKSVWGFKGTLKKSNGVIKVASPTKNM
jgi:hypothetical protein